MKSPSWLTLRPVRPTSYLNPSTTPEDGSQATKSIRFGRCSCALACCSRNPTSKPSVPVSALSGGAWRAREAIRMVRPRSSASAAPDPDAPSEPGAVRWFCDGGGRTRVPCAAGAARCAVGHIDGIARRGVERSSAGIRRCRGVHGTGRADLTEWRGWPLGGVRETAGEGLCGRAETQRRMIRPSVVALTGLSVRKPSMTMSEIRRPVMTGSVISSSMV